MFSRVGKCIVIGDINAHSKTECDYIVNDVLNDCERELLSLPVGYTEDRGLHTGNNDSSNVDQQSRVVIDICVTTGLRILNGRKRGDTFGACTYFSNQCNFPHCN